MPKTSPPNRYLGILLAVFAILLPFAVFALPRISNSPARSHIAQYISSPYVTWSENSVSISLIQGQSQSRNLTFTSSQDLSEATLRVTADVSRFLTADPAVNSSVPADVPQTIPLKLVAPLNAEPGVYAGTIEVTSRNRPVRTPLDIRITVSQRVYHNKDLGMSFEYPPINQPLDVIATDQFLEIRLLDSATNQFNPIIGLTVYDNPQRLPLQNWFEQHVDINSILASAHTFRDIQLENGWSALVLAGRVPAAYGELSGPVSSAYAITPSRDKVLSISQSQDSSLVSLGYSQQDIDRFLIEILGSAGFAE